VAAVTRWWRPARDRLLPAVVVAVGVWSTVGGWAALGAGLVCLVVARPRAQLTIAAVLLAAVVPLWFAGSTLPLDQAATRVRDNTLAPAVAGAAVWLITVAVVRDVVRSPRRPEEETP
jgi:hypothetical protein